MSLSASWLVTTPINQVAQNFDQTMSVTKIWKAF